MATRARQAIPFIPSAAFETPRLSGAPIRPHQDDYSAAEQGALELMSQTNKPAEFPRIGRVVPEYSEETLRELIGDNYRIPYRIKH